MNLFCLNNSLVVKFFLLVVCVGLGGPVHAQHSISGKFLGTWDYSKQLSDEGQKTRVRSSWNPAFEVNVQFPLKKGNYFETGYRYKIHWVSFETTFIGGDDGVAAAHSIPLRYRIERSLDHTRLFKRWTLGISAGAMVDFFQWDALVGLPFGFALGDTLVENVTTFPEEYVNEFKLSCSFDFFANADWRIYRRWHLFVGYGFAVGARRLANARYSTTYSTPNGQIPPQMGFMSNRGNYRYLQAGLRYDLICKKT